MVNIRRRIIAITALTAPPIFSDRDGTTDKMKRFCPAAKGLWANRFTSLFVLKTNGDEAFAPPRMGNGVTMGHFFEFESQIALIGNRLLKEPKLKTLIFMTCGMKRFQGYSKKD